MTPYNFNSDFWHMNPNFYNADDINPKSGEFAKNVWNLDLVKKQLCEKMESNYIQFGRMIGKQIKNKKTKNKRYFKFII